MSETKEHPVPTEINLHRKSRLLKISYSDGQTFLLPCEYLRVFSRAAEEQHQDGLVTGKESVNIERIEPQGTYAVRIVFDDGHDTSIYSWETLYDLGLNQERYWADYLKQLAAAGHERASAPNEGAETRPGITVMYFAYLANKMRRESESLTLPPSVKDVETLLRWLQKVKGERGYLLAPEHVRVTVNRQFAEPYTRLEDGDEVAIVPNSPNPPAPPKA
jgi:DUF971 family protein/molybdopterin converting factor small subunit